MMDTVSRKAHGRASSNYWLHHRAKRKRDPESSDVIVAEVPVKSTLNVDTSNRTLREKEGSSLPASVLDVIFVIVSTSISVFTRLQWLDSFRYIVFDEALTVHYLQLYLRGIFFYDAEPPLGKQLFALLGFLCNVSVPENSTASVGSECLPDFPLFQFRIISALCGALVAPFGYLLLRCIGFTHLSAICGAVLIICDNALLTHSRFAFVEPVFHFFLLLAVLCASMYNKYSSFSGGYWLCLCGLCIGCALCLKYCAVYTYAVLIANLAYNTWQILQDVTWSGACLCLRFLLEVAFMVVVPCLLYIGCFYIHFRLLIRIGPQYALLSPAFQDSPMQIAYARSDFIQFGSQITLRNRDMIPNCWLHSHDTLYPLRYDDGRGSSHQQQVTCHDQKDVNNWWIVRHPDRANYNAPDVAHAELKHGQHFDLLHGMTRRLLNSHDVGAPLSPQHQEVTCYVDHHVGMPPSTVWRVEMVNGEFEWTAQHSEVRLLHVETGQALRVSGKRLPEWGGGQFEAVADAHWTEQGTVWIVEEHNVARDKRNGTGSGVPRKPKSVTRFGFWNKLMEVHRHMFFPPAVTTNGTGAIEHLYESKPLDWPCADSTMAYYLDADKQIHLVGNFVSWYSGTVSTVLFLLLFGGLYLRKLRLCRDLSDDDWIKLNLAMRWLCAVYFANFVPYFFLQRTLFLYNYFPALLFQLLLVPSFLECFGRLLQGFVPSQNWILLSALFYSIWLAVVLRNFFFLLPLCCGQAALNESFVRETFVWKESWHTLAMPGL